MRERAVHRRDAKPTVRQVYAIARLLLAEADEQWPQTREQASELIERLQGADAGEARAAPA